MSYNDYSNYDDLFYDNNSFAIILLLLIFVSVIVTVVLIVIYKENKMKRAKEIAIEVGYFKARDAFMSAAFGSKQYMYKLCVSSNLVNNFNSFKYIDYLSKYFDMQINQDVLDSLIVFEKATHALMTKIAQEHISNAYIIDFVPTFVMSYTSPGGRSIREAVRRFDTKTCSEIRAKMVCSFSKRNHTKTQRNKMTNSLRNYILKRDNYTCQECGNSRYKEPNLLLEVDHIIPVSKGGLTEPDNLQTLCWVCNRNKSDNLT